MASSSAGPGSSSTSSSPPTRTGIRTVIACSNCRRRKSRCITSEQPPTKPCARCAAKNLRCEYVPVPESELLSHSYSHWRSPSQSSNNTSSFASASPPATYNPSPSHAYMAPHPSLPSMYSNPAMSRSGRSTPQPLAPPLPYTGPPPVYSRPRYSGGAYPDLALQAQPRRGSDTSPGTVNPAQLERSNSTGNENQEDYYFAFSPYGNPGG
ncbi:hypothetical protein C8F01DRAFT_1319342 [Mycena amicta]|nr:hypothetical protein C8F01DRAFT_1319342 [Mycena amicta]